MKNYSIRLNSDYGERIGIDYGIEAETIRMVHAVRVKFFAGVEPLLIRYRCDYRDYERRLIC